MIPSKKLKSNIKSFDDAIKKSFKRVVLNHSSPKGSHYSEHNTKGIESDLIYIYKPTSKKEEHSTFSFVFEFLNKEESEYNIRVQFKPNSHKPSIFYSWRYEERKNNKIKQSKLNHSIISTTPYTIDEFKLSLNLINNKLKEINVDKSSNDPEAVIFKLIHEIFFQDNTFCVEGEVNKQRELAKNLINTWNIKLSNEQEAIEKLKSNVTSSKRKILIDISNTEEAKEIIELENKLNTLKGNLSLKEKAFTIDHSLRHHKESLATSKLEHQNSLDDFSLILNKFNSNLSSVVKARVSLKNKFINIK
jgi:chaperonin cofactor prefoldin